MLDMFSASEARAIAYLLTPEDFALYQHLEIRILDSVQHGGTHIIHAGINMHVVNALRALGYKVTILQYEGKDTMIRVSWNESPITK